MLSSNNITVCSICPFQIQHKVTPCNGNPHIYCTCGVAVRSAADVFMIDRCPDRNPWYFGFPSCIENTLHVKKKKGNEWKYWVKKHVWLYISFVYYRKCEINTEILNKNEGCIYVSYFLDSLSHRYTSWGDLATSV